MTPIEFNAQMQEIVSKVPFNPELGHENADDLLCAALREAGYGAGVGLFESMSKWYA